MGPAPALAVKSDRPSRAIPDAGLHLATERPPQFMGAGLAIAASWGIPTSIPSAWSRAAETSVPSALIALAFECGCRPMHGSILSEPLPDPPGLAVATLHLQVLTSSRRRIRDLAGTDEAGCARSSPARRFHSGHPARSAVSSPPHVTTVVLRPIRALKSQYARIPVRDHGKNVLPLGAVRRSGGMAWRPARSPASRTRWTEGPDEPRATRSVGSGRSESSGSCGGKGCLPRR
jgi:hypothetical protein